MGATSAQSMDLAICFQPVMDSELVLVLDLCFVGFSDPRQAARIPAATSVRQTLAQFSRLPFLSPFGPIDKKETLVEKNTVNAAVAKEAEKRVGRWYMRAKEARSQQDGGRRKAPRRTRERAGPARCR